MEAPTPTAPPPTATERARISALIEDVSDAVIATAPVLFRIELSIWAFVRVRMMFEAHVPAPLTATPPKAPAAARAPVEATAAVGAASVAWTVIGPVEMSVQPWAASYVWVLRFNVPG